MTLRPDCDCRTANYQQCQATASGRFLTCVANPYYAGEADMPAQPAPRSAAVIAPY